MLPIFASADITIQTVERATAVRIQGVIIQEPGIPPFGFVQDCF